MVNRLHVCSWYILPSTCRQFRSLPSWQFIDYSLKPVRRVLQRAIYQFKIWYIKICRYKRAHYSISKTMGSSIISCAPRVRKYNFRHYGQSNALYRFPGSAWWDRSWAVRCSACLLYVFFMSLFFVLIWISRVWRLGGPRVIYNNIGSRVISPCSKSHMTLLYLLRCFAHRYSKPVSKWNADWWLKVTKLVIICKRPKFQNYDVFYPLEGLFFLFPNWNQHPGLTERIGLNSKFKELLQCQVCILVSFKLWVSLFQSHKVWTKSTSLNIRTLSIVQIIPSVAIRTSHEFIIVCLSK